MTAFPKSPSQSRAPNGTSPASLASGKKVIDRRWRLIHEAAVSQKGPLCDLYAGLSRSWAGPGVQLAGRSIRGRLRLHQEPGPCRLDPDPVPLWVIGVGVVAFEMSPTLQAAEFVMPDATSGFLKLDNVFEQFVPAFQAV